MRVLLACTLALAVGCGGGGGTTMATAQLAGTVYEVNGQSTDLAGVPVVLKETGEQAWTDAVGSFEFGGLEPGTYTLDFMGDGEGAAGGDEFADGSGDPKVDVPEGGRVEIRVALEDGEVKDFSSDCEEEQSASARLFLTDAAEMEGIRVGGAIKIAARDDGTLFKVCVEGLEGGAVIEIFVGDPPTSIGTAEAVEGRACLVLENDLPLGLSLGELAGMLVQVYLLREGDDLKLLVGEVPELMEEDDDGDEPGEGDGDKPDGEGDDDGEEGEDDGEKPDEGGDDGDKPDGDGTGEDGEGDGSDDGEEGEEPGDDGEGDGEGEGGDDGLV